MPSVFRRLSSTFQVTTGKKDEKGKGVNQGQSSLKSTKSGEAIKKEESCAVGRKNSKNLDASASFVEEKEEPKRVWRSARDPKSGRIYYYDVVTRETQWNKPMELLEPEERKELERREAEKKAFFEEMEYNMKRRFQEGFTSVDVGRPTSSVITRGIGWRPPPRQSSKNGSLSSSFNGGNNSIRTLSTMDDSFLILAAGRQSSFNQSRTSDRFMSPEDNTKKSTTAEQLLGLSKETQNNDYFKIDPLPRCATTGDRLSAWPSFLSAQKTDIKNNTTTSTQRTRASSGGGPPEMREFPPSFIERPVLASRNSTGTLFVDHTLHHPDRDATIRCVCHVIRAHVAASTVGSSPPSNRGRSGTRKSPIPPSDDARFDVFIDDEYAQRRDPPSVKELVTFYRDVFSRGQMEVECIVASLIYVERLLKAARGRFRLRSSNWRPTLLSGMIMASKVCDDLSMWNADFSHICRAFDLARINALEAALLRAYGFNATVSASEYAKYYFHLRSMAARLGLSDRNTDDVKPLDIQTARLVAARSRQRFPQGSCVGDTIGETAPVPAPNNPTTPSSAFVRRAQSIGVASQVERYAQNAPKPRAAILEEIVDMAPTKTPP